MWIQGSWCYTREIWTAPIRSRERAVPGIITGGMARGLNSRDEWLDPQRGANCSREDSGWYSVSGHTSEAANRRGVVNLKFVYTRSSIVDCLYQGSGLIPTLSSRWRAFGWPVNAR